MAVQELHQGGHDPVGGEVPAPLVVDAVEVDAEAVDCRHGVLLGGEVPVRGHPKRAHVDEGRLDLDTFDELEVVVVELVWMLPVAVVHEDGGGQPQLRLPAILNRFEEVDVLSIVVGNPFVALGVIRERVAIDSDAVQVAVELVQRGELDLPLLLDDGPYVRVGDDDDPVVDGDLVREGKPAGMGLDLLPSVEGEQRLGLQGLILELLGVLGLRLLPLLLRVEPPQGLLNLKGHLVDSGGVDAYRWPVRLDGPGGHPRPFLP